MTAGKCDIVPADENSAAMAYCALQENVLLVERPKMHPITSCILGKIPSALLTSSDCALNDHYCPIIIYLTERSRVILHASICCASSGK